jgi:hypothetical protein
METSTLCPRWKKFPPTTAVEIFVAPYGKENDVDAFKVQKRF